MVPGVIIKAVVPKVLDMILRQFKGIEKIERLVRYMEEDNDTDIQVKELENRVAMLEKDTHPEREFVVCCKCEHKIKEKE